ncbi:hypothetical protein UZ36_02415 [Candidatus Nitromaritima sp. SCGC AAA799-C22]|nr:hypothetical protein UZ36_02415 [Candidatus Nitromaritima sp. SCGC AAA799-C22]
MKIFINGKEETPAVKGETLGDFLVQIEQGGLAQGNIIRSIKLNGENMAPESAATRQAALSGIETLEIEVSTLDGIIETNLGNAEAYLDRLIPGIEQAADLFRTGNEQEANKFFVNIVDGMDWFSQVLDVIMAAKGLSPETEFDGKSIQDRRAGLIEFARQMVEANKKQDWVLLADLLEYEILPYYQEWENLLPEIRSKANSQ